ncbi:hypothetical protein B0H10DRAFT_2189088 [Mycena sp. CBHHK59/15]|nr:hypothetical protein B0H10DRAFT_2189088 [Mycena sp. CBHHK59/15]
MTILGKGRVGKSCLGRTVGRRAVVEDGQHRRGRDVVGVGRKVTWAVAPAWWKVVGGGQQDSLVNGSSGSVGKSSRRSPGRVSGMHHTRIDTHHAYHWGFECMFDIYMTAFNGATGWCRIQGEIRTFWFFLSLAPNSKLVQFVTPLSDDDSDYPRKTIDLSAPVAS